MTNLGQICLFSNLITILVPVQWCGFGVFLTGLKVGIYWGMVKISKMGGKVKKGENHILRGVFLSFLSIKTFVTFCSCSSRY